MEALKVLYRLHHAGYTAYLVGGGVHNLLLGKTPKDFDVVTDARPGELRKLFGTAASAGVFGWSRSFSRAGTLSRSTFRCVSELDELTENDASPAKVPLPTVRPGRNLQRRI